MTSISRFSTQGLVVMFFTVSRLAHTIHYSVLYKTGVCHMYLEGAKGLHLVIFTSLGVRCQIHSHTRYSQNEELLPQFWPVVRWLAFGDPASNPSCTQFQLAQILTSGQFPSHQNIQSIVR